MAKTNAADALEAYRRRLLSDDVEQRIADLAEAVAAWSANETTRERELAKLAATKWWNDEESLTTYLAAARSIAEQGWADQDTVLAAFEAAKAAGAKPATLQEIGLRPESALAAARARAKSSSAPTSTSAAQAPAASSPAPAPAATEPRRDLVGAEAAS